MSQLKSDLIIGEGNRFSVIREIEELSNEYVYQYSKIVTVKVFICLWCSEY